jgi:hypothetical protein
MTNKNTNDNKTVASHELVAKEEQNIGIFFAAFAIQFYLHKGYLSKVNRVPVYLKYYHDIEIYASQRVFINTLLTNKNFADFISSITVFFDQYLKDSNKFPHVHYLDSLSTGKTFLIRQIFELTDQMLSKYKFIKDIIKCDITSLDFNKLYDDLNKFAPDQQIMILARIFLGLKDSHNNKMKSIKYSFKENIEKVKKEFDAKNKTNNKEYDNLLQLLGTVD